MSQTVYVNRNKKWIAALDPKEDRVQLLRPANYSDIVPGPRTRPNVVIRIFELSLYYAGLNKSEDRSFHVGYFQPAACMH
jgi:hypothetical protein